MMAHLSNLFHGRIDAGDSGASRQDMTLAIDLGDRESDQQLESFRTDQVHTYSSGCSGWSMRGPPGDGCLIISDFLSSDHHEIAQPTWRPAGREFPRPSLHQ